MGVPSMMPTEIALTESESTFSGEEAATIPFEIPQEMAS